MKIKSDFTYDEIASICAVLRVIDQMDGIECITLKANIIEKTGNPVENLVQKLKRIRIMETPDFEVRNLSEYPAKSLEILLRSVQAAHTAVSLLGQNQEDKQEYDIWCYRIKDALSQAKKNEVTSL